jgi:hypothetical protein
MNGHPLYIRVALAARSARREQLRSRLRGAEEQGAILRARGAGIPFRFEHEHRAEYHAALRGWFQTDAYFRGVARCGFADD